MLSEHKESMDDYSQVIFLSSFLVWAHVFLNINWIPSKNCIEFIHTLWEVKNRPIVSICVYICKFKNWVVGNLRQKHCFKITEITTEVTFIIKTLLSRNHSYFSAKHTVQSNHCLLEWQEVWTANCTVGSECFLTSHETFPH